MNRLNCKISVVLLLAFRKELEALGLTAKWIDMPTKMERVGHLLAQANGTKGKQSYALKQEWQAYACYVGVG